MSAQHTSSPRSKILKLTIGLTLLVCAFVGWQLYQSSNRLSTRLDAIRNAGLPITAAELDKYYSVPSGTIDSTTAWINAIKLANDADFGTTAKQLPSLGLSEIPIAPPGQEWEQLEESRAFLKQNQPVVDSTKLAARQGGQVRFPVKYKLGIGVVLNDLQNCRQLARVLTLDAHVAAHDGDTAGAKDNILAILALSEALRGEVTIIGQLVRLAMQSMARNLTAKLIPHGDWADEDLLEIQQAMRNIDNRTAFLTGFYGERAMVIHETNKRIPAVIRSTNIDMALRLFQSQLDGLENNWNEGIIAGQQMKADIQALNKGLSRFRYTGVLTIMPAMSQAMQGGARADAGLFSTDAAIAAKRFQMKNGRLPDSLDDLVPDFLPSVPVDPFDGKPMRFTKTKSAVIVYSVSNDQNDDGGKIDDRPQLDYGTRYPQLPSSNDDAKEQ